MDWLWVLLGGSISGVAVAGIAKLLLPGKQVISGIEMLAIGTAAGFLGGLISGLFGLEDETGWKRIIPLAISVGLAALAIYFWLNFRNKQIKNLVVPGESGAAKEVVRKSKEGVANAAPTLGAKPERMHGAAGDLDSGKNGGRLPKAPKDVKPDEHNPKDDKPKESELGQTPKLGGANDR